MLVRRYHTAVQDLVVLPMFIGHEDFNLLCIFPYLFLTEPHRAQQRSATDLQTRSIHLATARWELLVLLLLRPVCARLLVSEWGISTSINPLGGIHCTNVESSLASIRLSGVQHWFQRPLLNRRGIRIDVGCP